MKIDHQRLQDDAYRQEVLEALLRDFQHLIFRYCVARLGESLGDEVAQEVFVTAWEALPKFQQEAQISTWLVGIAKNKCAQAFRNRERRAALTRQFAEDIRHQVHAAPSEPYAHQARDVEDKQTQLARLVDNLDKLRADERILLTLRYWRGIAVSEIAEMVGQSEDSVRKRLQRALHRLKERMDDATAG